MAVKLDWRCVATLVLLIIVTVTNGQASPNAYGSNTGTGTETSTGTSTGTGCTPVPNVLPTPNTYNFNQFLTTGPWYGYLTFNTDSGSAQNPTDINLVNYYTSLGKTVEPTRTQEADIVTQEKRRYTNGACTYFLEVGHFTADGRQTGPYFDKINAQGAFTEEGNDASIIWSTDQSTYIMFFWCSKQNRQTGNCASTHVYVYTRTKPTDMSASQKQTINSALNAVLQPYCINTSQFLQYQFDNSLPECPAAPRPDCFQRLVKAYDDDDLLI